MLELSTKQAIMEFVKSFRVVRVRQIKRFFSDRGERNCNEALDALMVEKKVLHDHGDGIVSTAYPGKLPSPMYTYEGTMRCLDMMTGLLQSGEVQWFQTADFPLNIMFLTTANELYDVSYVDSSNWVQKAALFPSAWKRGLPAGQDDPFNHIAVVPSLDVAKQLRYLPFDQFVLIDSNGGVLQIYDNDK